MLALAACGESAPSPESTTNVAIGVAPLDLPGLANACYSIEVTNGASETVWSKSGICATAFGDSQGSISYVGPCDASAGVTSNTVTLVLEDLFDAEGRIDRASYQNPCGDASLALNDPNYNYDGFGACELTFTCQPNSDVPVAFDITVMREANQGFFDVAVNFEDIFCSAKVDCNDPTSGAPIDLLFNAATGKRDSTAVAAFACYSGTAQTVIHMSDVQVVCPSSTYSIIPSEGPGNLVLDASADEILFAAAVYEGVEAQAGRGLSTWSVALGIDELALPATGCKLVVSATASEVSWPNGFIPGAQTNYPVMSANVDLSIVEGNLTCGQHPLNASGSQLVTTYVQGGIYSNTTFCNELVPGATDLTSTLLDCAVTNVFIGDDGGTAVLNVDGDFYSASAPSDAFVDGDGQTVVGTIAMIVTTDGFNGSYGVGGSDDIDPALIADFTFVDENGIEVQVAPNTLVTIRIPLPLDSLYTAGEPIDFYSYNETLNTWELTASGTVVAEAGRLFAEAAVPHFTWYGVQPAKQACVNVTVTDANGNPLPNITVRSVVVPASGGAYFAAPTGADGTVCLKTRALNGYRASIQMPSLPAGSIVTPSVPYATAPFTSVAACGGACLPLTFQVVLPSSCNGTFVVGEECDGGDYCAVDCTCEAGTQSLGDGSCTYCGNGNLDGGELCDPLIGSGENCRADTCECEPGYDALDGMCVPQLDGICSVEGDLDCDNVCNAGDSAPDCDNVCAADEEGSDDCNQNCDINEGGSTDCNTLCQNAETLDGPDCDGTCQFDENSATDCNALCNGGEGGSIDCDFTCQPGEDGPDCNNVCDSALEDGSTDCNFTCDAFEAASNDCNTLCQNNETSDGPDCDGVCQPSEDSPNDCNGFCNANEDGSNDCNTVCTPGENGPDCDTFCASGEDGSNDCNLTCESGDAPTSEGGPDCNGSCETADAANGPDCDTQCGTSDALPGADCDSVCEPGDQLGSPDCDTLCQAGELDSIDCDTLCQPNESGSDCNNICYYGEEGSTDCDTSCEGDDAGGGPDCNNVCQVGENGADCNTVCQVDEQGSNDCDTFCVQGEQGSSDCDSSCGEGEQPAWDGGPDCNYACETGDAALGPDCNTVCSPGDTLPGPDCDGVCDVADQNGSPDCDYSCAPGEVGSLDCDLTCMAGEEGSTDCNGICAPGETGVGECNGACDENEYFGSADCNSSCEAGDALGHDCNTLCDATDENPSLDCDGVCGISDAFPSADCDGACDVNEVAPSECDNVCEATEGGSNDCDDFCSPGEFALGDSPDCMGPCTPSDAGSQVCNNVCDAGDTAYMDGGPDCNGFCAPGEQGTSDCNDTCEVSDLFGSVDCDTVCDFDDEASSPDCDGDCSLVDDSSSYDCEDLCEVGDVLNSADCNGACDFNDAVGSPDCNTDCETTDDQYSYDCNGKCEAGDQIETRDCDGQCSTGDQLGSHDCDGACGPMDLGGPDCNNVCGSNDDPESMDCNEICTANEETSPDCTGFCSPGENASSPDCNELCDGSTGEETGSVDCNLFCQIGEFFPDCNGSCDGGDQMGSYDCDGICEIGDVLGSNDCNWICDGLESTVESSNPDCDGGCQPGENANDCNGICEGNHEAGSDDCDGVCDSQMDTIPDCDGICSEGEALGWDCDGDCESGDDLDGPDCLRIIDLDVGGTAVVETTVGVFTATAPSDAFVDGGNVVLDEVIMFVDVSAGVGNYGISGGGTLVPETIADIYFAFRDPLYNMLNLATVAPSTSIALTIPLPATTGHQLGDTVPVYYYDTTNSVWVQEATGTVVAHAGGLGVSASVTHFTYYAVPGGQPNTHNRAVAVDYIASCFITLNDTIECTGDIQTHVVGHEPAGDGWVSLAMTNLGYTCALHGSGHVECWGDEQYPMGGPTTNDFIQISAGTAHVCGLRDNGSIACWGDDFYGQSTPPVGTGFVEVAAGGFNGCALDANRSPVCWGYDDPTVGMFPPPTEVGLSQLGMAANHSCAIKSDGVVACWGAVGPDPATQNLYPVESNPVLLRVHNEGTTVLRTNGSVGAWMYFDEFSTPAPTSEGYVSISSGRCAENGLGATDCWGDNGTGRTLRTGVGAFVAVAPSDYQGCALRDNGIIGCWSYANYGDYTTAIPSGSGYKALATDGNGRYCAIKPNDQLVCFGTTFPTAIVPPAGTFKYVAGSHGDSVQSAGGNVYPSGYPDYGFTWRSGAFCGIRTNGSMACWGNTRAGTGLQYAQPGTDWVSMTGGGTRWCAVRTDHTVLCWGVGSFGFIAGGNETNVTKLLGADDGVQEACVLRRDKTIGCFGQYATTPPTGSDFVDLAKAGSTYCAVRQGGELACWPGVVVPPAGSNFVSVFGGSEIAAIRSDGSIYSLSEKLIRP